MGRNDVSEFVPRQRPVFRRDWLLGWVIACMHEQFGFALDVCRRAHLALGDPIFKDLTFETERMIHEKVKSGRTAFFVRTAVRRLRSFGGRVLKPGARRGNSTKNSE